MEKAGLVLSGEREWRGGPVVWYAIERPAYPRRRASGREIAAQGRVRRVLAHGLMDADRIRAQLPPESSVAVATVGLTTLARRLPPAQQAAAPG